MPRGYSATTGNPTSVKRLFAGMNHQCKKCGHKYVVSETMERQNKYRCPACAVRYVAEYRKRNLEKARAWSRAYQAKANIDYAEKSAKYRANHPEKRLAHQAVQIAVRKGTLVKMPCEVCGSAKMIHGHHDDYSKPLDVNWLCHKHHMERHEQLKERDK